MKRLLRGLGVAKSTTNCNNVSRCLCSFNGTRSTLAVLAAGGQVAGGAGRRGMQQFQVCIVDGHSLKVVNWEGLDCQTSSKPMKWDQKRIMAGWISKSRLMMFHGRMIGKMNLSIHSVITYSFYMTTLFCKQSCTTGFRD